MEARTDDQGLHDLRVKARRLKSLLRPIRKLDDVKSLDQAASKFLKLTSPLRDLEVLANELAHKGATKQARSRQAAVGSAYAEIVRSPEPSRGRSQRRAAPAQEADQPETKETAAPPAGCTGRPGP
ncbi:CHAD domain protein [compost metagenome]